MKNIMVWLIGVVAGITAGASSGTAAEDLDAALDNALQVYESKTAVLADGVLRTSNRFTNYSNASGVWRTQSRSTWTSGFVPGIFWYMHDYTGENAWLTRAENWTEGVRAQSTDSDNDTGFQIYCSFGLGYALNGKTNTDYFDVMTTAANTLDTQRFNSTIGCFRSWRNSSSDPVGNPSITDSSDNPTDMVFEANIDQMMNLELILFVGTETENQSYIDHAISHADTTWENHVREVGSTFHVVGFNLDGSVQYKRTHQGWQTDSTWSRGQAWSVYGYTMVYRYTGLERMLDRAEACLEYFLTAVAAQSNDTIPYSDFDAAVDGDNPRDTSAAAIVASASMDLYDLTGEESYLQTAEMLLADLTSDEYLSSNAAFRPVLTKGSEKWNASSGEVGTIFGDFYLLEAILRYKEATSTQPPVNTGPRRLMNIATRGLVGTGDDIMIGGFTVSGESAGGTFLIRGVGPTLGTLGVSNIVEDPVVTVFRSNLDGSSTEIAMNDDWGDDSVIATAGTTVGAFDLDAGSSDAALLLSDLEPGGYTVQLSGKTATTQNGLIEVYKVD